MSDSTQASNINKTKKVRNICIVGGEGAMGQLLIRFLSTFKHYSLTSFTEPDWKRAQHKLTNQELVILATPISSFESITQQVSALIKPHVILADITSIKTQPLNTMLTYHSGPVMGLHPIFGPTITKADKQVVVHCSGRGKTDYKWFLDDIKTLGFNLKDMTATDHDKSMSFIQAIEHFSVFCMGLFLKNHKINIDELLALSSPVYKMELNIIGRLFSQDGDLYANIIGADQNRIKLLNEFSELIKTQAKNFQDKENGKDTFVDQFNQIKEWMGSFAEKSYIESDRLLGIKH